MGAKVIDHVNLPLSNTSKRKKYWPFFLIGFLVCLSIAALYFKLKKPSYIVQATYLIPINNSPFATVTEEKKTIDPLNKKTSDLKVRTAMAQILRTLNFQVDYELKEFLGHTDLYKKSPIKFQLVRTGSTFSKALEVTIKNNQTYLLKSGNAEAGEYNFNTIYTGDFGSWVITKSPSFKNYMDRTIRIKLQDPNRLMEDRLKDLRVKAYDSDFNLVELTIQDPVMGRAEDLLRQIPSAINLISQEETASNLQREMKTIEDRLSAMSDQVDLLQKELSSFSPNVDYNELPAAAASSLGLYKKNDVILMDINIQVRVMNKLIHYIRSQDVMQVSPPNISAIAIPGLKALLEQLLLVQSQHQQLSKTQVPSDAVFEPLKAQSEQLKTAILQSVIKSKRLLINQQEQLKLSNDRASAMANGLASAQLQLIQLKRKQYASENLYAYLARRKEAAALNQILNTESCRMIKIMVNTKDEQKTIVTNLNKIKP